MRCFEELAFEALDLHDRLSQSGEDPVDGVFYVTERERLLLYSLPAFHLLMDEKRQRLCGLLVKTVHTAPAKCVC